MEAHRAAMMAGSSNVVFMSSILGQDGLIPTHKCDWKCQNEHVCGNMYRCRLTGQTHICDKNCDQRILYDNHNSLCRVSGLIFPLSPVEQQAARGFRRKLEAEACPPDSCSFKRRRLHPSPFERSFSAVSPICSQVGDGRQRVLRVVYNNGVSTSSSILTSASRIESIPVLIGRQRYGLFMVVS